MSIARRLSVLAAAGALGLTLAPAPAEAQEPPFGEWRVTDWSPVGDPSTGAVTVSGTIQYEDELFRPGQITQVELTLTPVDPAALPPTCIDDPVVDGVIGTDPAPAPIAPGEGSPPGGAAATFAVTVHPRCNGTYLADVAGSFVPQGTESAEPGPKLRQRAAPPEGAEDPTPVDVQHVVAAAPPPVRSLSTTDDASRAVRLVWDPPDGYGDRADCTAPAPADHPDFTGYLVQRASGDGPFTTLDAGTVPVGQQCLVDQLPPDAPDGTYRYRVLSTRSSPNGTVTSTESSTPVVPVQVGVQAESPPTSRVRPPSSSRIISRGSGRAGGATAGTVVSPIDDGTYEAELDYGEPGEEAAVLPEDADSFLDFVPSPGEGILVPFAIAECLAVWALHLRYLARRADDAFLTPERTLE